MLSIKKELSEDFEQLMHKVAFESKDYELVIALGSGCFQRDPSSQVALRNAKASAALHQLDHTIGWLQAYERTGGMDLKEILKDPIFDPVRSSDQFKEFSSRI